MTYVYNGFSANGVNVDFKTSTKKVTASWWDFWTETGTWKKVSDAGSKSMSQIS